MAALRSISSVKTITPALRMFRSSCPRNEKGTRTNLLCIILVRYQSIFPLRASDLWGSRSFHSTSECEPGFDYDSYWVRRGRAEPQPRYKIFSEWCPDGSSVLDLGCGDGALLEYLIKQKRIRALGVDVSAVACRKARERGIDVIVADVARALCLRTGSFDVAICSEVLEHLAQPEQLLHALRQAAKKVYVSIPNIAYYPHRLRLLFGRFPIQYAFHPAEHLRYWSVSDFEDFVKKLGYDVKRMEPSNGFPLLYKLSPNLFANQVCFELTPGALENS